ncbi:MAG: hypothetical protein SGJ20_21435 [Planctomycetota bacterium]|nr:hypothetical protein [Planctomycetota bacterium]
MDDTLPHSTLDDLKRYYPDFANVLGYQRMRDQLGIGVGNSWPVALAGYVLNSLARDVEDIHSTPYVPKPGDEYFSPDPPIQS